MTWLQMLWDPLLQINFHQNGHRTSSDPSVKRPSGAWNALSHASTSVSFLSLGSCIFKNFSTSAHFPSQSSSCMEFICSFFTCILWCLSHEYLDILFNCVIRLLFRNTNIPLLILRWYKNKPIRCLWGDESFNISFIMTYSLFCHRKNALLKRNLFPNNSKPLYKQLKDLRKNQNERALTEKWVKI